jgi:adenylylsulfate kinase-like enzyme
MIIWLIGLSDAGKTVIGRELADILRAEGEKVLFLDGDVLRDVWRDHLDHSLQGRRRNHERISHLCKALDQDPKVHVIVAALSIFPDLQKWNRENFGRYFEVFIDIPLEAAMARDSKGIYAKARQGLIGNIVGVDIEFPRPPLADMTLTPNILRETPRALAIRIRERLGALQAA